jgi:drug/metabolite transporter (DMT)-like permease
MPPIVGALLAVTFWGVSFVATKAVLREISPEALIFGRAALGTLLLAAILAARRQPILPPRGSILALAAMGFIGVTFHQLLQAYALRLTTAVNTGWLIGLVPVWSSLLSLGLGKERFGASKALGILIGLSGALLVVTRGNLTSGLLGLPSTRGDLLVLASTVNWALYTVVGHATIRKLGPTRATAGSMLLGWVMLLPPFLLKSGFAEYAHLSAQGLAALLFLGVACSGLGYLFWYGALERIEPSRVSALLYLEPLVTLAAAVVLLSEPIGMTTIAGGLLVIGGVAVVQRAA